MNLLGLTGALLYHRAAPFPFLFDPDRDAGGEFPRLARFLSGGGSPSRVLRPDAGRNLDERAGREALPSAV